MRMCVYVCTHSYKNTKISPHFHLDCNISGLELIFFLLFFLNRHICLHFNSFFYLYEYTFK